MLSALRAALWIASLFCDLLYLGGAEAAIWSPLALYTLAGGFVAALAAAELQIPKPGGIARVPIDLIVLGLYALNLWLRLGDSPDTALAIALSIGGVSILAVSSWLGARVRVEGVKTLVFASSVAVSAGLIAWTNPVGAQLLSATAPVIAILDGELLLGEATGHLGGWGTIALHSRGNAGRTCEGEFSHREADGDSGQLRCCDGASAAFRFERLSLRQGYGVGNPGGSALSFTYGLSVEDSAAYLDLPPGKELIRSGGTLELVAR